MRRRVSPLGPRYVMSTLVRSRLAFASVKTCSLGAVAPVATPSKAVASCSATTRSRVPAGITAWSRSRALRAARPSRFSSATATEPRPVTRASSSSSVKRTAGSSAPGSRLTPPYLPGRPSTGMSSSRSRAMSRLTVRSLTPRRSASSAAVLPPPDCRASARSKRRRGRERLIRSQHSGYPDRGCHVQAVASGMLRPQPRACSGRSLGHAQVVASGQEEGTMTSDTGAPDAERYRLLSTVFIDSYRELLDGRPEGEPTWITTGGPEGGVHGTLADVTAEEASRDLVGATIAGHAYHLWWAMDMVNRFVAGEAPNGTWADSWSVAVVTPAEWDRLRQDLRQAGERLLTNAAAGTDWAEENQVRGALASYGHAAYHLGAIRQLKKAVKGRN